MTSGLLSNNSLGALLMTLGAKMTPLVAGGAAFHQSCFSLKRLFIEAAFHRSGFSSKRLFIKCT